MVTARKSHPWVAAYAAGATARQVAAEHGTNERTVRRRLRTLGEPLRVRGARALDIDGRHVATLREAGVSWTQIGRQLGCSPHGAKGAMIRAGFVDRSLSDADMRALAAAVIRVPAGRGARFDLSSRPGGRLVALMRRLQRKGASLDDFAYMTGVSPQTVARWLN